MDVEQFINDLTERPNPNTPVGDGDVQRHFNALFALHGLFTVTILWDTMFSSQALDAQLKKIEGDIIQHQQPITIVPVMVPAGKHARLVLYIYEFATRHEWLYDPLHLTRKREREEDHHWFMHRLFKRPIVQIPDTKIVADEFTGELPCLLFAAMILRFWMSGSNLKPGAEKLSVWWNSNDLHALYQWHRTIGPNEHFGTMRIKNVGAVCGVYLEDSSTCARITLPPSVFCEEHRIESRSAPPAPKVMLASDPALFFIEAFMCDIGVSTRLPMIVREPLRPANYLIKNSTFTFSENTLPWITLDRAYRGLTCITSALQSLVDESHHFGNTAELMTPSFKKRRLVKTYTRSLVQMVISNDTVQKVLTRGIDTWNIIFNSILDKLPNAEEALKQSMRQVDHARNNNAELELVLSRLEECLNQKGDSRPVILPLSLYTNDYRSITSFREDPVFSHATVLIFDPEDRTQWYFDPQLHGSEKGEEGIGFFEWMKNNSLLHNFTPKVVIPSKELLSAFSVQTAGDGMDTKFSIGGGCTMFSFLFATLVCRFQARGIHLNSLAEDLTHWLMLEVKQEDKIQDATATRARLYHWQHRCLQLALRLSKNTPPPWSLDSQYRTAQMLVGLRQLGASAIVQRPCGVFLKEGGRCGHPVMKGWTLCSHHCQHLI